MRLVIRAAFLGLLAATAAHGDPTSALVATLPVESEPFDIMLPEKVGLLAAGEHLELAGAAAGATDEEGEKNEERGQRGSHGRSRGPGEAWPHHLPERGSHAVGRR